MPFCKRFAQNGRCLAFVSQGTDLGLEIAILIPILTPIRKSLKSMTHKGMTHKANIDSEKTGCISTANLKTFAAGTANGPLEERITKHFELCENCINRLAEIEIQQQQISNRLVELLRTATNTKSDLIDLPQDLKERLQNISDTATKSSYNK